MRVPRGKVSAWAQNRASTVVFLGGGGEGIREGRFSSLLLAVAKRCPLPTPLASESLSASHQLYNFSSAWKSLQVVVSLFRNWKLAAGEGSVRSLVLPHPHPPPPATHLDLLWEFANSEGCWDNLRLDKCPGTHPGLSSDRYVL